MTIRSAIPALVALGLLCGLPQTGWAGDPIPTRPVEPGTPWVWVVTRLEPQMGLEWELSAYFAALGSLELDFALVDRRGETVAAGSWELVAGVPTDYRLPGFAEEHRGEPLSLLISGLELGPDWLSLSLWRRSPDRGLEEIQGDWIRSDPSWLSGVRSGP